MESALMFAGGGAVAGQLKGVLDYNRTSWTTNVSMRQSMRYQQQNLALSLVGLYREDIRDLVSSSMTTQGNYLIMNTLMLSMLLMCFQTAALPAGTHVYRQQLYTISVGASLVFLLLSILYTVMANQLSVKCQRSMLVNDVRLPIEAFAEQIESASEIDNAEEFEAQGLATMFRIPGIGQFRRLFPKVQTSAEDSPSSSRARSSEAHSEEGPMQRPTQAVQELNQQRSQHLDDFYRQERTWTVFMQLGLFFGILGVIFMLSAFSHYALAQVETSDVKQFATGVPAVLMCVVQAMMFKAAVSYLKRGQSCASTLGACLIMSEVVWELFLDFARRYGMRQYDLVLIVLYFASQVFVLLVSLSVLTKSSSQLTDDTLTSVSQHSSHDKLMEEGQSKASNGTTGRRQAKISRRNATRSVQMSFVAVAIVVVSYVATLVISITAIPEYSTAVLSAGNSSARRLDSTWAGRRPSVGEDASYAEAEEFLATRGANSHRALRVLRQDDIDMELRKASLGLGAKAIIRHWYEAAKHSD